MRAEEKVLEAMSSMAVGDVVEAPLEEIAFQAGVSRRSALEAVRSLIRQGVVVVDRPGGGRTPTRYRVVQNTSRIAPFAPKVAPKTFAVVDEAKETFGAGFGAGFGANGLHQKSAVLDGGKGTFGAKSEGVDLAVLHQIAESLSKTAKTLELLVQSWTETMQVLVQMVQSLHQKLGAAEPPSSPLSAAPLSPIPPNTPPLKPPISPLESPPIIPPTGLEGGQGEGEEREGKPEGNPQKPFLSGHSDAFEPSKPTGGAREAAHEPADLVAALRAKGEVGEWALRILQAAPGRLHANLPRAVALLELHGPEVARELWEHARATAEHSPLGAWLRYADSSVPLPPEVRARLRERLEAHEPPPPPPPRPEPESEEEWERRRLREVAEQLDGLEWIRPLWAPFAHRREEWAVVMAVELWRETIGKITAFPRYYVSPDNAVRMLSRWAVTHGERLYPGTRARFEAATTPEAKVAVIREVVHGALPPREGRDWEWLVEHWKVGERGMAGEAARAMPLRHLEVSHASA